MPVREQGVERAWVPPRRGGRAGSRYVPRTRERRRRPLHAAPARSANGLGTLRGAAPTSHRHLTRRPPKISRLIFAGLGQPVPLTPARLADVTTANPPLVLSPGRPLKPSPFHDERAHTAEQECPP